MSKIINNFTSKEQVQQVLDKLNEYEGIKITNHNTYDSYPNDKGLYIRVDGDTYCYGTYKSNYENEDGNIIISAEDYLHPIKEGDVVKIQDDSRYNGYFSIVLVVNKTDCKLEINGKNIWKDMDVLQILKKSKEEFKVGDKVEIILEETYDAANFSSSCGDRTMVVGDTFIIKDICGNYLRQTKGLSSGVHKNLCKIVHDEGLDSDEVYSTSIEETETILNNNNKNMNTIQREAKAIATEDYFANNKIIKKVRQADAEMQDLLDILENALKEIDKKRSRLNGIATNFNRNYYEKNMDTIKDMLNNHKEVVEFMDNFIAQSVSDFTEETTKEKFNVEDIFNS